MNFRAMIAAGEIRVWYDDASGGGNFDMSGVFLLVERLGWRKRLVSQCRRGARGGKSLLEVMKRLIETRRLG